MSNNFGTTLRQLRKKKNLTQAQVAKMAGTSQQNIAGIEPNACATSDALAASQAGAVHHRDGLL
jgi:transcriptional regulator with XRE-family HTH domain